MAGEGGAAKAFTREAPDDAIEPRYQVAVEVGHLRQELAHLKQVQKNLPRSEGARLFAVGVTQIELGLFALKQIGLPGYELE